MTLDRIRDLFYIAVIALAIILDCTGGVIGWATAVVILVGARPMFHALRRTAEQRGVNDYRKLRKAAAHHILSSAQVEQDAYEVGQ